MEEPVDLGASDDKPVRADHEKKKVSKALPYWLQFLLVLLAAALAKTIFGTW